MLAIDNNHDSLTVFRNKTHTKKQQILQLRRLELTEKIIILMKKIEKKTNAMERSLDNTLHGINSLITQKL